MTAFLFWELTLKFLKFSMFFSPSVKNLEKLSFCVPQEKWKHKGLESYETK